MISFTRCFHIQWEVFSPIKFHPGMKLTRKQKFFHPGMKFHLGYVETHSKLKRTKRKNRKTKKKEKKEEKKQ